MNYLPYRRKLWTPAQLIPNGNMVDWHDASDANTISDTSGLVNSWSDKSGRGNVLTASSTARPTTNSAQLNGLNLISFDGSTDEMIDSTAYDIGSGTIGTHLIGLLVPYGSSTGVGFLFFYRDAAGTGLGTAMSLENNVSGNELSFRSYLNGFAECNTSWTAGNPQIFSMSLAAGATYNNSVWFINGTSSTPTGTSASGSYSAGTKKMSFGAANADGWANADIAEILFFKGILTTEQRQKIEGYLAWKWKVQSLLPTGHPFKLGAPK